MGVIKVSLQTEAASYFFPYKKNGKAKETHEEKTVLL